MKHLLLILLAGFWLIPVQVLADEPFIFMPQWSAQAQFAGYYVAQQKGFYAEEGIEVKIVHPFSTESAEERIRQGEVDATALPLVEAMELSDKGIRLVNILQTSMNSATMLISRYGGDPLRLGKARVATWRVGYNQLATCLIRTEGLQYEAVEAANSVNIFVAGAVEACLAMSYNEYNQILQAGLLQDETGVFRFSDHGYNIQEDGVYMTRAAWEKKQDQARRFARASRRGWEWAAAHPEETLQIIMTYIDQSRIATNRTLQRLMLEEVLRQQLDPDSGERSFRLRPDMVEKAGTMMVRAGLLQKTVSYEDLMP